MNRFERQSFLGEHSEETLASSVVGIVGLGGGGSHLVQQFAHIGIGRYVLSDPDRVDDSNMNRLVGATLQDARNGTPKVEVSAKVIRGLIPNAEIDAVFDKWPAAVERMKRCDLIMGAVDSYCVRDELERFARRYLIPYIDIGMDVHPLGKGRHLISGQVISSMPGHPCLRCCGLITDEKLKRETETDAYGAAGGQPQVVWPNGVLASTAVGLAMRILTPWFSPPTGFVYLEYDGNKGKISESGKTRVLIERPCVHYRSRERGEPFFDMREYSGVEELEDGLESQEGIWMGRVRS